MLINASNPTSVNKIVNEIKSHDKKFSKDFGYELANQTENIYLFLPLTKYDQSYVKEVQSAKKYYSECFTFENHLSKVTPCAPTEYQDRLND